MTATSGKEKHEDGDFYDRFRKQHRRARRGSSNLGKAQAFATENELAKLAAECPERAGRADSGSIDKLDGVI